MQTLRREVLKNQKERTKDTDFLALLAYLYLFIIDSGLNLGTNPDECKLNLIISFHVSFIYDSIIFILVIETYIKIPIDFSSIKFC